MEPNPIWVQKAKFWRPLCNPGVRPLVGLHQSVVTLSIVNYSNFPSMVRLYSDSFLVIMIHVITLVWNVHA